MESNQNEAPAPGNRSFWNPDGCVFCLIIIVYLYDKNQKR